MENPIKMGWVGGTTIFGNPHLAIWSYHRFIWCSHDGDLCDFDFPSILDSVSGRHLWLFSRGKFGKYEKKAARRIQVHSSFNNSEQDDCNLKMDH